MNKMCNINEGCGTVTKGGGIFISRRLWVDKNKLDFIHSHDCSCIFCRFLV